MSSSFSLEGSYCGGSPHSARLRGIDYFIFLETMSPGHKVQNYFLYHTISKFTPYLLRRFVDI